MPNKKTSSSCHLKQFQGATIGEQIPRSGNAFTRWLGRVLIRLQGWKVEGTLPNEPKLIAAAGPHTSNWDFCVAMPFVLVLGLKVSYLAKNTLFIWPFKYFFEWLGGVPLDRSQPHGVVGEMVKTFEKRDRFLLVLAPEGTRSKAQELKTGFLHMAMETGVPICLIGIDFSTRTLHFGPVFHPCGDLEKDKKFVMDYFATQGPKNPEMANFC